MRYHYDREATLLLKCKYLDVKKIVGKVNKTCFLVVNENKLIIVNPYNVKSMKSINQALALIDYFLVSRPTLWRESENCIPSYPSDFWEASLNRLRFCVDEYFKSNLEKAIDEIRSLEKLDYTKL